MKCLLWLLWLYYKWMKSQSNFICKLKHISTPKYTHNYAWTVRYVSMTLQKFTEMQNFENKSVSSRYVYRMLTISVFHCNADFVWFNLMFFIYTFSTKVIFNLDISYSDIVLILMMCSIHSQKFNYFVVHIEPFLQKFYFKFSSISLLLFYLLTS